GNEAGPGSDTGDEQIVNICVDVVWARRVGDEFDACGLVRFEQRLPDRRGQLFAQRFASAQIDRGPVPGRDRRGGDLHSEIAGAEDSDVERLCGLFDPSEDPFGVAEVVDRQRIRVFRDL